MRAGIEHGFVKFDSFSANILRSLHKFGPMRQCDLREEHPLIHRNSLSQALFRLSRFGFIFNHGKAGFGMTGERTQAVYGLQPGRTRCSAALTTGQRMQRWRESRQKKVASVFEFRGVIEMKKAA